MTTNYAQEASMLPSSGVKMEGWRRDTPWTAGWSANRESLWDGEVATRPRASIAGAIALMVEPAVPGSGARWSLSRPLSGWLAGRQRAAVGWGGDLLKPPTSCDIFLVFIESVIKRSSNFDETVCRPTGSQRRRSSSEKLLQRKWRESEWWRRDYRCFSRAF